MFSRTSGNITAAVILILLTGVQAQHSVTLSSQSLCALTGSSVKISCKYTTADSSRVRETEWYQLQSSDGEERVLSKDPQFSARVSVRTEQNDCDLTVRDVRLRDSGVYNFRFRPSSSDWISASSGVNLTVTELQVKVDHKTAGQRKVKVICSSTCSLGANPHYDWYRNEVYKAYTDDTFIVLDSTRSSDEGSYSCQVEDSSGKRHRSPSVCVLGKECWGVTYTPERVCALKGSSVDLSCSYNPGGHTVTKSVWFIKEQAGAEPVDVREDEDYQGRVQYRQSFQNDCSMRITHLRESDAQTYRFRFYTDGGEYTGQPGVTLSVTDLKVSVSDTDSGGKKLNCSSTCTLPNNLTYIWYKNGQPVIHCKSAFCSVAVVSGTVSYSCAVEGHVSLISPPLCSAELWKLHAVWGAVGVVPVLALFLLTAILCIKRKRRAERDTDIQTPDPADHTYAALNPATMTSDYDTLQAVHPHREKRRAPEMKNERSFVIKQFYECHNKPDTVLQ
ncbi:sialoadhesin-like isoform X2 [Colossoma macropomum]|uniref:sialoadhesin-like isoform X2 n=1 Tax=Colossoma macropomum TaxID=42526 RepID=UPI001864FD06|nr:sialoadhesin-like isoform X2 [Colossoma macropomum]